MGVFQGVRNRCLALGDESPGAFCDKWTGKPYVEQHALVKSRIPPNMGPIRIGFFK